jgi:hypothetical protein
MWRDQFDAGGGALSSGCVYPRRPDNRQLPRDKQILAGCRSREQHKDRVEASHITHRKAIVKWGNNRGEEGHTGRERRREGKGDRHMKNPLAERQTSGSRLAEQTRSLEESSRDQPGSRVNESKLK